MEKQKTIFSRRFSHRLISVLSVEKLKPQFLHKFFWDRIVIFSVLSFHSNPVISQTQFQVAIGTASTEVAECMIQTSDSGYVLGGYAAFNAYIAKLDKSQSLQWTRTFAGQFLDEIKSIVQTTDGGYIAAGSSVFKLDSSGTLQWCVNISGGSNCVIQTSDGGYAVAGYTNSFGAGNFDMFIVKLSNSGSLQWARTVGGTGPDFAYSIIHTLDGGYAVAGDASFGLNYTFLVIKLDSSGSLQWARLLRAGPAYSIIQTADGGYAATGIGGLPELGRLPYFVAKLDTGGALEWTSAIWRSDYDISRSIIQTSDDGYAVIGYAVYIEGWPDWLIIKLSPMGTLQWSKTVGGTGFSQTYDEAYSIIRTLDGGYGVAGLMDSVGGGSGDMYIVKFDSSWNTCGNNVASVSSFPEEAPDTMITVTPTITSPTGFITPRTPIVSSIGWVTTFCVTGIKPTSNRIPASFKLYQNYPNPFNGKSKIKIQIAPLSPPKEERQALVSLKIYDILGREVDVLVNQELRPGVYEHEWEGTNYASGVYYYRLQITYYGLEILYEETKRMVLTK